MKKLRSALLLLWAMPQGARAGLAEAGSAYNSKIYSLADKEILPLVKAGKADAQCVAGVRHCTGNSVLPDHQQAVLWLRKAPSKTMPRRSRCWARCAASLWAACSRTSSSPICDGIWRPPKWQPGTPLPRTSKTGGA